MKRAFGPFIEVPAEEVSKTSFRCMHCKEPVEVLRQVIPYLVPRLCVHACQCGAIAVWEDERQPTAKAWYWSIKMLRQAGAKLAIFNGNKELDAAFSGRN
jgi:hypothetical protein